MIHFLWIAVAYLCGSIPFGLLIPSLLGKGDPRTMGSGNTGATNVYRLAGIRTAILVYLCDALKGVIPTALALPEHRPYVALFCVMGHIFSIFLKGKGGKGVATACGVLLVLMPKAFFIALGVWSITWKATGYVSLSSLMGCLCVVIMGWMYPPYKSMGPFSLSLFALLLWAHRSNIMRLIKGQETTTKKPPSQK